MGGAIINLLLEISSIINKDENRDAVPTHFTSMAATFACLTFSSFTLDDGSTWGEESRLGAAVVDPNVIMR